MMSIVVGGNVDGKTRIDEDSLRVAITRTVLRRVCSHADKYCCLFDARILPNDRDCEPRSRTISPVNLLISQ